ncbi:mitochondrial carrier family [Micromonas pusilla CCMP1545]|uniref:Mitochondrial carrier family n=1 Tax=Micromonas pusilla (strain CCMP1545) TaxID=564608 RepID=C1N1M1_MICPC|nr:mitochondrial carrier family [Micromonas pusilla CCMP1545]EEH54476.1 mitochondrial carrier family [Micromonas pusilla CCMP1545]|eukprot:XP_003061846.1 mitochondrial carrier family [Micromonas pusilla CCMP1545]
MFTSSDALSPLRTATPFAASAIEGKRRRATLSDAENLAVGAFGGIVETCVQMPLITFKICVQSGKPLPSNVAGWYRGVVAAAAPIAPITAIQVAVNGAIERSVTGGVRDASSVERIGVAMAAGATSSILYSPVDLIVIQQQKRGLDSAAATIKAIASEHGALALCRGLSACVVREAIYTAGYLGLAPIATESLVKSVDYFKENELTASIVGSCVGGTVAAVLTHPVDTAKTCVQSDMAGGTYPNARSALMSVYNAKGIKALYGGGLARTARLCGAFFIINTIRDRVVTWKTDREEAAAAGGA